MAKCYTELSPERVRSMRNETIALATEVCTLRLEVPVLESERDMSDGLCRALGTRGGNCDQGDRCSSIPEKQY